MSKLSRAWKNHVEPFLEQIFRGGDARWIPTATVEVYALDRTATDDTHGGDFAIREPLPDIPVRGPRTITGNVDCLPELIRSGLSKSGQDRWRQELLCSESTPSSSIVACIQNGRILHRDAAIIDHQNRLIQGVSGIDFYSDIPGNPLKRSKLVSPERISGTVAVLTGFASFNYYHWLIDIVPKLSAMQSVGIPIDYYFIPQDHAFQRDTVKALGINSKAIIAAKRNSHLAPDRILAATWDGLSATSTRVQSIQRGFASLLASSLPNTEVSKTNRNRIYISRRRSGIRRIVNENELFMKLRGYGFELLCLEGMSMRDQITAFRSADVIVAPHGAGLANLCFCRPNTKVLEITTPYRVLGYFARLASAADLEFHLHLAIPSGKKSLQGDTAVGESNMQVDVKEFERALEPLVC